MQKYRRIEVNAFRRRVTISGEWPREVFDAPFAQTDNEVSLDDSDVCEPVEPDSPEGQLLLVEAVRSLERRLLPQARASIAVGQDTFALNGSSRNGLYRGLRSIYHFIPKVLRSAEKKIGMPQ